LFPPAKAVPTLTPERWARYCALAGALLSRPDGDSAALAWLTSPRRQKTGDYTAEFLQRLYPNQSLGFDDDRADNERRREALELEDQFRTLLIGELRAGRWEGTSTSRSEALRGGIVPVTTWNMSGLDIDLATGDVTLDGAALLGGLAVRPVTITPERSEAPPLEQEEAMPAEGAVGEAKPEATSEDTPITSEADAAQAYLARLNNERDSTGRPPTRDADYYQWAFRVRRKWRFHVTQDMIDEWRRALLTDDKKKGGAPLRRK
jgi:hypothetical protein